MEKHGFLRGTLILTATGLLSRIIGFFYRIFLSHTIGASGVGIYQLIFPIQGLLLALTTTGIQTSISRNAARKSAQGDQDGAVHTFLAGTGFSLFLSLIISWLLCSHADFFGSEVLKESQTIPLLRLLALSLPLSALHGCINSYHFALKKVEIPAFIQLLEQSVRVFSVYLVCKILLSEGKPLSPTVAAVGILASELAAALCGVLIMGLRLKKQHFRLRTMTAPGKRLQEILQMAAPLTANRVLLTLLASVEVILIPQQLRKYGLTPHAALSVYGVFTGMALPLILFPNTITNSAAAMLLPSIAQLQATGKEQGIQNAVRRVVRCCLLLGIGCGILFFLFGKPIGYLLFKNSDVGLYLQIMAFICPFLYLNTTLASVLNGLGRSGSCLIHNVAAISIRILFVVLVIPICGIRGYLWGILGGELTLTLLHCVLLSRCHIYLL